jgi:phosphoglycerate dehydrogenase-like enzyme
MAKPLMLLMTGNPQPYLDALKTSGLLERIDTATFNPGERPGPASTERAEMMLAMGAPQGLLGEMKQLKWVQSLTAGVDQWMTRKDRSPSMKLTAARGTHRVQMPENILGSLFHITKPIGQAVANQRESKWVRQVSETLAGKTLGILGIGAIGVEVARKAAALEMTVIGIKRDPTPVPHVEKVYPTSEVAEVLGRSDFVVALLPTTPETENFMNKTRLGQMRRNAWLLNFGRGHSVVDEDLIAAVKNKTIAGAVLDVFRTEPLPSEHPFWRTEGIVVLPHIGGFHRDRDKWVAELLADNTKRYLAGEPLRELVEASKGY